MLRLLLKRTAFIAFLALWPLSATATELMGEPTASLSVEATPSLEAATPSTPVPTPFVFAEHTMGRPGSSRVWIRGRVALSFDEDHGLQAKRLAERLASLQQRGMLQADRIVPGRRGKLYVVSMRREDLITFDERFARRQAVAPATLALRYINQLRTALGAPSLQAHLVKSASRGGYPARIGLASWYGGFFHGRRAADGSRFDQNDLTAAHKSLPFGTMLLVTNLKNQKSTIVRVTDRGPYVHGRMVDLSRAAAHAIGLLGMGVGKVRITIFPPR